MKTVLDQMNILYERLSIAQLGISGSVEKDPYTPLGKEDIVINSLPVVGDTQQNGQANVNVYIPSNPVVENGRSVTKPNLERFEEIVPLVINEIEGIIGSDYNIEIESTMLYEEPEIKYHYFNIKVNFEFLNCE